MNAKNILAISGFALAGSIVYLAVELGKTRASVDRVTSSPTISNALQLSNLVGGA